MPTHKTMHKSAHKAKGKKKEAKKKPNGAKASGAKSANNGSGEVSAKAKEKLKKSKALAPAAADDIDPEEAADEAAALAEVDPDAVQDHVDEEPIADRKEVKDLLEVGRQKGFLTYDEVNDALPADIVSSDQIDDVMSMFGDNEIEIVDAQKAAKASDAKPAVVTAEEPHKDLEEEEPKDEDDEPGGKSNDPVRLYLRKMGSVSLLTREGEVEIAKRIEEGEKEVLRAVLACKVAVAEILDIGTRLRSGKLRIREVVKDAPEEPAAEGTEEVEVVEGTEPETAAQQLNQSELNRIEQICKQIERIRKYAKDVETLEEDLSSKKKVTEVRRREVKQEVKDLRVKMMEILEEMRLNKKQIDRIVLHLRSMIEHVDKAEDELREYERKVGVSMRELRPLLKESRENPNESKKLQRRLNMMPEQLEALDRDIRTSVRKIRKVEEDANLPIVDLRRNYHAIRIGEKKAEQAKSELVRVQAWLQILDLCDVVDSTGDHPRDCGPGSNDPNPGPHDRDDQQADPYQPLPGPGDRPRADSRGNRGEDGAAARQGSQGPEDCEGADLARDADRGRRGFASGRLHRRQEPGLSFRRGDQHEPRGADPKGVGDVDASRGEGAPDAVWNRRKERPHPGGSGPGLRSDSRAYPPDRGQGTAQAAAPLEIEETSLVRRGPLAQR